MSKGHHVEFADEEGTSEVSRWNTQVQTLPVFLAFKLMELTFTDVTTIGIDFVQTQHHDTYPAISTSKANLSGKVVIITGASRGIGRATALSYAKAGASGIVVLARSDLSSLKDDLIEAAKDAGRAAPKVLGLSVDATDRTAIEKAANQVTEAFGKVDILINNAGYLEQLAHIDSSDPEEWWKTWEINVKGVYLMTKFFLPLLLKSELKTVVVVSSIGAHITMPGMSAYQTTKLAVLRLNDFLMAEYGEKGLIAFGVHPGVSQSTPGRGHLELSFIHADRQM